MNRCLMIRLCELFYIASYTPVLTGFVFFCLFIFILLIFFGWENIAFTVGEQNF